MFGSAPEFNKASVAANIPETTVRNKGVQPHSSLLFILVMSLQNKFKYSESFLISNFDFSSFFGNEFNSSLVFKFSFLEFSCIYF